MNPLLRQSCTCPCPCRKLFYDLDNRPHPYIYFYIAFSMSNHNAVFKLSIVLYNLHMIIFFKKKKVNSQLKLNQLHVVSCSQQCRQREPSVKTLRSTLSAEFWMHCVFAVAELCRNAALCLE